MIHGHPVIDTDKHFIIDPISRTISNAELKKTILMQRDHNSERFSFEIDRYIEEHDMILCNQVEIHYINTGSPRQESTGIYLVDDFKVADEDDKKCVFTWLVSENATMYAGSLAFLVMFKCTDVADGRGEYVAYRWHSGICTAISISKGMNNEVALDEILPDIVAQWHDSIFTSFNDQMDHWNAHVFETNFAYEEAVNRGYEGSEDQWYASLIAESVTAVSGVRANPGGNVVLTDTVTGEAYGDSIAVADSILARLRGLAIYGKTIQDGTPSLEESALLESVTSANVSLLGKNIVDWTKPSSSTCSWYDFPPDGSYVNIAGSAASAGITYTLPRSLAGSTVYCTFESMASTPSTARTLFRLLYRKPDMSYVYNVIGSSGKTVTIPKDSIQILVQIVCNSTSTALTEDNEFLLRKPMVSLVSGGKWEPYKESQAFTPYFEEELRGIPVSRGGNYTDETGQQWICDDVDYDPISEKVTLTRRIGKYRLNGDVAPDSVVAGNNGGYVAAFNYDNVMPDIRRERLPKMCDGLMTYENTNVSYKECPIGCWGFNTEGSQDMFLIVNLGEDFTTPEEVATALIGRNIEFHYVLDTPYVEEYLKNDASEIRDLLSWNGVTTVLNDGGAGMKLTYVADASLHYGEGRIIIDDIPGKKVTSVNGKSGDVELTAEDIGGVTSVNGQTGDVTVNVGVTKVNGQTGDVTVNVGVTKVNGQTGDVKIPTTQSTTISLAVPTTGWTFNQTYNVYSQTFTVAAAKVDADMFIDCIVGGNFPILGARCENDGQVIIYMSNSPVVAQNIALTFKTEV